MHLTSYQKLAFLTPGIRAKLALSRKHSLHMPNFLKYDLGLPQRRHRFLFLTLNLGSFFDFSKSAFLAISCPLIFSKRHTQVFQKISRLFIPLGRSNNRNIHALYFVDLSIVNLRKYQLLPNTQCKVSASVKSIG